MLPQEDKVFESICIEGHSG